MGRWGMRWLIVVGVALVAAACAGSDDSSSTSSDDTAAAASVSDSPATDEFSWLLVIDAASATADGTTLTLTGVEDEVITFTDRPVRDVNRAATSEIVDGWESFFGDDPPNAALGWTRDGVGFDAVIELSDPVLDGTTLRFSYVVLEDTPDRLASLVRTSGLVLPPEMTDVSLFVDAVSTGTITMTFQVCPPGGGGPGSSCETPPANVIDAINTATGNKSVDLYSPPGGYVPIGSDGTVAIPSNVAKASTAVQPSCDAWGFLDPPEWKQFVDWANETFGGQGNGCVVGGGTPGIGGPAKPSNVSCFGEWTVPADGGTITCQVMTQ